MTLPTGAKRFVLRRAAIAELFAAEPIMYEPDAIVVGREAISAVAGGLLDRFGPDFTFGPIGGGVGIMVWDPYGGRLERARRLALSSGSVRRK